MTGDEHVRDTVRGPMTNLAAHDESLFQQEYINLQREADLILQQAIESTWKRHSRRLGSYLLRAAIAASYGPLSYSPIDHTDQHGF